MAALKHTSGTSVTGPAATSHQAAEVVQNSGCALVADEVGGRIVAELGVRVESIMSGGERGEPQVEVAVEAAFGQRIDLGRQAQGGDVHAAPGDALVGAGDALQQAAPGAVTVAVFVNKPRVLPFTPTTTVTVSDAPAFNVPSATPLVSVAV